MSFNFLDSVGEMHGKKCMGGHQGERLSQSLSSRLRARPTSVPRRLTDQDGQQNLVINSRDVLIQSRWLM